MSRAELKAKAKEQISGKVLKLFVVTLIGSLLAGVLGVIPIVGAIISAILTCIFTLSYIMIYLKISNSEDFEISEVFAGFSNAVPAIVTGIVQAVFIFLWSLLFVIPGIIKTYAYSMAYYILAENPDMSATEVLKKSEEMMNGHKMELFVLHLSFIPWFFLVGITFGLAGIYVAPYVQATMANFYKEIKG